MGKTLKKSSSCPGGLSIWWSDPARRLWARFSALCVLGLGFGLAACGFVPVYQVKTGPVLVRAIDIQPGGTRAIERDFAQALRDAVSARVERSADALHIVTLGFDVETRNLQVDESGLARRIELTAVVTVRLSRPSGAATQNPQANQSAESFTLRERQSMARSESGADQLRDTQILIELAAEELAGRLALQLSQRLTPAASEGGPKRAGK